MQQIYMQSDSNFEVFTTVLSPQVCRTRTRTKPVEENKVVAAMNYRPHWEDELELSYGDIIEVLFKEDHSWWFGRLQNGNEGYFPSACVDRFVSSEETHRKRNNTRRGSVPVVIVDSDSPCGYTGGRGTPRPLRKDSIWRATGQDTLTVPGESHGHNSHSLLHRVLSKSRRKSCPHITHSVPPEAGSDNAAFQAD